MSLEPMGSANSGSMLLSLKKDRAWLKIEKEKL